MWITRRMFIGMVGLSAVCLGQRNQDGYSRWSNALLSDGNEELLRVKVNGRIGFIDRYGTVRIEPKFESIWGIKDGLAPVQIGWEVGIYRYRRRDSDRGEIRRNHVV